MKKQNFENYKLDLVDNKKFHSMAEFEFIKDPRKNKTQLGVGSFGEVKLAVHKKTSHKYAIKIMNLKNMNSFQEIQGIEREVRVHNLLKHPNIIEYHDSFQENEFVFIVLDYASNGNLYSHLYKKRSFSEREGYKYFSQTCEAIKYLHSINIVHRDLKPENILLDEDYNIKVCDFGWCTEDIENPRNTFCGTYEYMAPEIVFRQPYDYRIDIWALGVLMYELLHGSAPFKGKTFKEIQRKIEKGDVQFSDSISDISKQLICKVLQANPTRRISIEDIMSHSWMSKMRQIEKDEKKSTEQTKSSTNLNKVGNALKPDENDTPKVKEFQQIQKKPDNRSQSPIIGGNLKANQILEVRNETKHNEKENISNAYTSICNTELSERKKNNTPNKTTASIPKSMNDPLSINQKKLNSNTKINQSDFSKNQSVPEPQTDFSSQLQKDILSGQKIPSQPQSQQQQQQQLQQQQQNQNKDFISLTNGFKDKSNDRSTPQMYQQVQDIITKAQNNGQSLINKTSKTTATNASIDDNPFKNLDSKDIAQLNNIAKKQQEMMLKMSQNQNNFSTNQQGSMNTNNCHNNEMNQQQIYVPSLQTNQFNKQQKEFDNLKSNQHINTESAYSKDIDENSIKNSQKTINTSRFINKHGSVYGNGQQNHQTSINNSINSSTYNNHIESKGINISQALGSLQNKFFNQTEEINFHNEININQSNTKTEGNVNIANQYNANKNLMNPNTSIGQEESCFSMFGCLGPSHISTTQRTREASSSNQRIQAKQIISTSQMNVQYPPQQQSFSHAGQNNSVCSQLDNRPRINSTNAFSNNSFLNKQSVNGNTTSHQYSTLAFNSKDQLSGDKNTFSTQRSSNSLGINKMPSISNHSFLGQQQNQSYVTPQNQSFLAQQNSSTNSRVALNCQQNNTPHQSQQHRDKLPFADKTNLPVSAIPTKQINLQDERKNLYKLSTSSTGNKELSQQYPSNNNNNNNFISNNNNNNSIINNSVINTNNTSISNLMTNQFLTKERSLTQDYHQLQTQYGNLNSINQNGISNSFIPPQKQLSVTNNNNNNNNCSLNNFKLDGSKNGGQSFHDVSRSNRTGQRSRTLIFEELNTEKTKSVIESMEQMISFVKNALPFSSSQSTNTKQQQQVPTLQNNQSAMNNYQNFQGNDQTNYNDISSQVNISILQNTSLLKTASADASHTPSHNLTLNQKQSSCPKQIININNLKSQRMESQNINEKQQSPSQQQVLRNNIHSFNSNNASESLRNKQKIFGDKGQNNAQSFHSNHTPMQSIPNMSNISVNNYFTQKTSPSVHSYTNIPSNSQQGKLPFNLNDCSLNKLGMNNQNPFYHNDQSSIDLQSISLSQRR